MSLDAYDAGSSMGHIFINASPVDGAWQRQSTGAKIQFQVESSTGLRYLSVTPKFNNENLIKY